MNVRHSMVALILLCVLVMISCMLMNAMRSTVFSSRQELADGTTVVVVLGEMLVTPGIPSKNLQARMTATMLLLAENDKLKHVIFSGGDTAKLQKTEAAAMSELWHAEYFESKQARHVALYMEEQSLSTCQNAFYSIPILQRVKAKHIIVVTSDYHAARAKLLFEQVFATQKVQLDVTVRSAPVPEHGRQSLFVNERHWLQPHLLKVLLTNMTDYPFNLPDTKRIEQARHELMEFELGTGRQV